MPYTTLFRSDANGKERRESFNIEKQGIIGAAHLLDGNKYLLLLSGKTKGQFAHLELK